MACVPQFDTMHPSISLGANFNDRIFADKLFTFTWIIILYNERVQEYKKVLNCRQLNG